MMNDRLVGGKALNFSTDVVFDSCHACKLIDIFSNELSETSVMV